MKITLNNRLFWIVSILIFLLPVFKEIEVLAFGEKVNGTVVRFEKFYIDRTTAIKAVIKYEVDSQTLFTYGPDNVEYYKGEQVPLLVLKDDPEHCIIATLGGFIVNQRFVGPIVLFIVWTAFFFTLKESVPKRVKSLRQSMLKKNLKK